MVVNIGGHFSLATHSFVCPIHGIYAFFVTFVTQRNLIDTLELRKNNIRMVEIWAYDDDTYLGNGSGSTSIVLECFENDDVRVVTAESGTLPPRSNIHVFSGYLLYKL